jgi:hypothetical protein
MLCEKFRKPLARHGFRSGLSLKNPLLLNEKGDVRRLRRAGLQAVRRPPRERRTSRPSFLCPRAIAQRLRSLADENSRLKRLVADLSLDKERPADGCKLVAITVSSQRAPHVRADADSSVELSLSIAAIG